MLNSVISMKMTLGSFLICIVSAIVLGVLTAVVFTRNSRHTDSVTLSLALLPPIVTLIIMLVNGNIGAGLAVAGTFALVRFRSLPGTAKEISGLFFSVALGLACGMGFVGYAVIFFIVMAAFLLILEKLRFGQAHPNMRQLKITVPENLDYDELFDDLLEQYTLSHELTRIHTTNMGTLYELTYDVAMRDGSQSREFINALRCRNGNLAISLGREIGRETM